MRSSCESSVSPCYRTRRADAESDPSSPLRDRRAGSGGNAVRVEEAGEGFNHTHGGTRRTVYSLTRPARKLRSARTRPSGSHYHRRGCPVICSPPLSRSASNAELRSRPGCGRARSTRSWASPICSAPIVRCGCSSKVDRLSSVILWGPPGTGKTTIARLIAGDTAKAFEPLSAVTRRSQGRPRGRRTRPRPAR